MTPSADAASENRLLLVDGHGYAYRAFHAIAGLKAPDGRPTNAIFGFIKMLEKARAQTKPTHLAVIWDGGLDEERVDALPEYKAQRPEMPDELEVQLDQIDAYLEAAGVLSVCHDGVEADDLIATLAGKAACSAWSVVIATSDKDFMQLVSDRVALLNPADKARPIWGEERVIEKTGVRPSQVVDWLSLVGDNVDNIAGVRGVGPKTAAKLLNQFETVDGIYGALDEVIPERLRSALGAAKETVLRNRALVRLRMDLKGAPEIAECVPRGEDRERLGRMAEAWGFRSMAATYGAGVPEQEMLL